MLSYLVARYNGVHPSGGYTHLMGAVIWLPWRYQMLVALAFPYKNLLYEEKDVRMAERYTEIIKKISVISEDQNGKKWHGGAFYDFSKGGSETYNWSNELEMVHDESEESGHPIDINERKLVIHYIQKFALSQLSPVICDFGCSTGYMLQAIQENTTEAVLLGVDVVESGLVKLKTRMPETLLFKFDITKIPFPENMLDVIVCLSVLEHIEDDVAVISEFKRVLKNGGVACIVVPYGDKLYDYYDKFCMHVRRYGKNELLNKLENAGFKILRHSYLSFLLYFPFWVKKKMNRFFMKKEVSQETITEKSQNDIETTKGNFMIRALFDLDAILSKNFSLPFGIREIVLVQK